MLLKQLLSESGLQAVRQEKKRRTREQFLRFVLQTTPNYQCGWVHEDICARLQQFGQDVLAGKSPRLMLFMPPRHGKSLLVSQKFPVWFLANNPAKSVIVTSYSASLSSKFSRIAITDIKSAQTQRLWNGITMDQRRQTIADWGLTQGGGMRAVGIGGSLTGDGADILIIDDPVKNWEEAVSPLKREKDWDWYQSTAYTRLMPGAGVLLIMTRWHEDDLAGRLLKASEEEKGEKWQVISYPAIAEEDEPNRQAGEPLHPERYDAEALMRIRTAVGEKKWTSLFQQQPKNDKGEIVKRADLRYYARLPDKPMEWIQSWDLAFEGNEKSDFVVGQIWAKDQADCYLVEQIRGQWDFKQTLDEVVKLSARFPQAHKKYVEKAANGSALLSFLQGKIQGLKPVTPVGNKTQRLYAVEHIFEGGNVYLPYAPWIGTYVEELVSFPRVKNDDQVDATTQALAKLNISYMDKLSKALSS